ncbi:MAG: leucine-rich repeat protein, partial [Clostridia bacterium]|nr:leucine-rich repeat protein [Clostridia bacterium]
YDYKDGNKDKQRIYLDLDVFDNVYAQSVILCYSETQYDEDEEVDTTLLKMVTDYVTPVYNANKNGTTTVTIEITDIYDKFGGRLYVQLDDYALNSNVYALNFTSASDYSLPSSFEIVGDKEITIGVNEVYKVQLSYEGEASLSAFKWECRSGMGFVKVKNGEIFGVSPGTSNVTVVGLNGFTRSIIVHVVESNKTLDIPTLSFGVIEAYDSGLQKAQGTVKVRAGQTINLEVVSEAWYYPVSSLDIRWTSSNEEIATVNENGKVITQEKKGLATITATAVDTNGREITSTRVTLSVQEPFTVNNYVLTRYYGLGGELINGKRVLKLPDDQNIMSIAEDAFKDNDNIQILIIPKTVTEISESAFENCKELEEVYFISQTAISPADADLATIRRYAFRGCNKLKKVDLSNCKTITLDRDVFANCTALEEVVQMQKIGTMGDRTFQNTALKEVNLGAIAGSTITGLHRCGSAVFSGCTSLTKVTVDEFTAIGDDMFRGCTSLNTVDGLNKVAQVGNGAFLDTPYHNGTSAVISGNRLILAPKNANSISLSGITEIAPYAFSGCTVNSVTLTGVTKIGEGAFANSTLSSVSLPNLDIIQAYAFSGTKISSVTIPATVTTIGDGAFYNCENLEEVTFNGNNVTKLGNAVFSGTKISTITIPASVKEVGDMVFANCELLQDATLTAVETLGSYSFLNCPKLETVVFGDDAKTTGDYTFFAGKMAIGNNIVDYESSLKSVTFGNGITKLGEGVFVDCDKLVSIKLNKITEIGASAFESCINLNEVEGLNKVTKIGAAAFAYCTALPENLVLSSAENIGDNAFYNVGMTTIEFPNAKTIGAYAFSGNKLSTLTLPAGITYIGNGAFAGASNLTSVAIASGNTKYFAEDGVLYRYITQDTYELCIYPAARNAAATDGIMTYSVKEGTVSIQGGSFCNLNSSSLQKVKIPYSVKVIGAFAFYNSGIGEYEFECINAPTLYVEPVSHRYTQYGYYVFFYTNFQDVFADYVNLNMYGAHPGTASTLKISYPTNGTGYDNYIFSNYFGTKVLLGELMDDTTREVKKLIESFADAATVAGWNTNTAEYDDVYAFSENVKTAHRLLNTITSQTQLDFLGADNVKKLSEIEKSLKDVKQLFGIKVTVVSLKVDPDCNYKSEYKEGEKFNMNGLRLIVTYDDYSTDYADMSQVSLVSGYDGGLTPLDIYVILQGYGKQVQVAITVTEGGAGGFKAVYVWAPIVGVVGAAGIAVGCFFLIKYLKKRKKADGSAPVEEAAASTEPTEEAKPEAEAAKPEAVKPEAEEVKPAKPKKKQTAKNSEKKD